MSRTLPLVLVLALFAAVPAAYGNPLAKKLDCTPNCPPPPNCVDPVSVTTVTNTQVILKPTTVELCLGVFIIQQFYVVDQQISEATTIRSTLHCNGSRTNQVLSVTDTPLGFCYAPLGTFCTPASVPAPGTPVCKL